AAGAADGSGAGACAGGAEGSSAGSGVVGASTTAALSPPPNASATMTTTANTIAPMIANRFFVSSDRSAPGIGIPDDGRHSIGATGNGVGLRRSVADAGSGTSTLSTGTVIAPEGPSLTFAGAGV